MKRTIIDKLAATIERISIEPGGTKKLPFLYDDAHMLNIRFDRVGAPLAAAILIESGVVTDATGVWHERITMGIWFADIMPQATADQDGRITEQVIDKCKERAFRWAASLMPTEELKLISVNGSQRSYLDDDATLCGYWLNVTLEEVEGYGRCNG